MLKQIFSSQTKTPSLLTDPFKAEKITHVGIYYWGARRFGSEPHWTGVVEFQNSQTEGKYKTQQHENMEGVITELKSLLMGL